MSAISWLLFGVCATAAILLVGFVYRKREMPGRGRTLLAGLRAAAVILLIVLLFDPELPAAGMGGARGAQTIVDGSLSMVVAADGDAQSRWSRVRQQARQGSAGRDVLLFGAEVRALPADSLPEAAPGATASRLLPALQAASEAGVRRVVVLTDGAIEDAAEVSRWLPRLGLDIDFRTVAPPRPNAALAEVEAPRWAEAGKPLDIRYGVAAVGAAGGAAEVTLVAGADVLATASVTLPEQGRVAGGTLRFTPEAPEGGALVRYDVRLTGGDAAPDDDVRSVYIYVSDTPAGVALVSFRPDWEPRFLQPVLAQALGVPVRGYLHMRGGAYVTTGSGLETAAQADEAEVRRVVAVADLVVLHGLDAQAPAWATALLSTAPRLLVLPAADAAGLPLPAQLGRAVTGDWYVASDVPPSPLAASLAGLEVADVPPLTALHFAQAPATAWAALQASRGRRGTPSPLALAGETAGRRWAVALGDGYWRWAFRGGDARQVYARMWGALAGWLVQEQGALAAAPVRPGERVVARGAPLHWIAPGLAADSMRVVVQDAEGNVVRDTTVVTAQADTASTAPLPPGHYRYEATAFPADGPPAAGAGQFTVESYSPEFTRPAVTLSMLQAAAVPVGPEASRRPGRPLHSAAWPYGLIVLLIAAEWVLRRRWGLR